MNSLVTCPRCRSPVFDCVCEEWHAAKLRTPDASTDPVRLVDDPTVAPGDALAAAVALLQEPTLDDDVAAHADDVSDAVLARIRAKIAAGKGGRG